MAPKTIHELNGPKFTSFITFLGINFSRRLNLIMKISTVLFLIHGMQTVCAMDIPYPRYNGQYINMELEPKIDLDPNIEQCYKTCRNCERNYGSDYKYYECGIWCQKVSTVLK